VTAAADRAKYLAIAAELRADIDAGRYAEGDRLPSENELSRTYDVAAATARRALDQLQREQVAVGRAGAGVYVRRFAPIVRASPDRLAREQWAAGRSIWEADANGRQVTVDQVDVQESQADEVVARLLDLEPGTRVWVRSRRYVLDGRPVQLATSYLPADLADGTPVTQPDPGPGGIYGRLAERGVAPSQFVEEVRARPADPSETAALNLSVGAVVLHVVRTAITSAGRPVETNAMTMDASAYVLRYAFTADG
jgi:GntR family transcriptional regulator